MSALMINSSKWLGMLSSLLLEVIGYYCTLQDNIVMAYLVCIVTTLFNSSILIQPTDHCRGPWRQIHLLVSIYAAKEL